MKNGIAFLIIVIAFVVGAFLPYFYLNGKIEKANVNMDKLMESVKVTNDKLDRIGLLYSVEQDVSAPQEKVSDISDQKLHNKVKAQAENSIDM